MKNKKLKYWFGEYYLGIPFILLICAITFLAFPSCEKSINFTEGDKYCDYFLVYQIFGVDDRSCVVADSATMISNSEAIAWQDGKKIRLFAPEIRIHRQPCY